MNDPVNHPDHYTQGSVEVIDIIRYIIDSNSRSFESYLISNIVKYLCRYNDKDNPVQDLKKAKWFLEKLLDVVDHRIENEDDGRFYK